VLDEDYGARIRAAQAYTGLKNAPFVEALNLPKFSERTLERVLNNDREPTIPEARRIAEVCEIPLGFLIEGWTAARTTRDQLGEIERSLGDLRKAQFEQVARDMEVRKQLGEVADAIRRLQPPPPP
jgi:transcriptional regulator with XRE-family HTH domain